MLYRVLVCPGGSVFAGFRVQGPAAQIRLREYGLECPNRPQHLQEDVLMCTWTNDVWLLRLQECCLVSLVCSLVYIGSSVTGVRCASWWGAHLFLNNTCMRMSSCMDSRGFCVMCVRLSGWIRLRRL